MKPKNCYALGMKKHELDLYTYYLISQFGYATATRLSALLDGEISHDSGC
jgi:hypothetical protein